MLEAWFAGTVTQDPTYRAMIAEVASSKQTLDSFFVLDRRANEPAVKKSRGAARTRADPLIVLPFAGAQN